MIQEIVVPYGICGAIFGLLFEMLVKSQDRDHEVKGWERVYWVSLWPFCLVIFLYNFLKGFWE